MKKKERIPLRWQLRATQALFFIGGFGTASWAPLVPILRERLAITEDVLGMLLLCIGIGSLSTMPLSGSLAAKFGCRRTLAVSGIVFACLLLVLCSASSMEITVPTLLLFGAAMGCIDCIVNIQAILVENNSRRRLMSGMHALWSVGGFIGAGLFGVWVGGLGLTPFASTLIASAIILLILAKFSPYLLPYGVEKSGSAIALPRGMVLLVGVVAFIAFLTEGAIMDWSGVFLHTARGLDLSMAGTGFAVFSIAMLLMRLIGDRTVNILGQKIVVIGGSLVAFAGFMLLIFTASTLLLYVGFFLIGIGSANIVPVFYSLLGKQKDMPVSVAVPAVSTMGYLGVLAGPAVLGFLAHLFGLYASFAFLSCLVLLQTAFAGYVYKKIS